MSTKDIEQLKAEIEALQEDICLSSAPQIEEDKDLVFERSIRDVFGGIFIGGLFVGVMGLLSAGLMVVYSRLFGEHLSRFAGEVLTYSLSMIFGVLFLCMVVVFFQSSVGRLWTKMRLWRTPWTIKEVGSAIEEHNFAHPAVKMLMKDAHLRQPLSNSDLEASHQMFVDLPNDHVAKQMWLQMLGGKENAIIRQHDVDRLLALRAKVDALQELLCQPTVEPNENTSQQGKRKELLSKTGVQVVDVVDVDQDNNNEKETLSIISSLFSQSGN